MSVHDETPWIEPAQARSREKVDRILEAALRMVVESGSLDLKMTEVAKAAKVAVGTLYQFFPSRAALIGKLFEREMAPVDASVAAALSGAGGMSAMARRIEAQMNGHLRLVRSRPGLMVIWSSASVDPAIQAADMENTRRNAGVLAESMIAVLPQGVARKDVEATALLICHLWSSVIRLCVMSGKAEAARIIRQYAVMIAAHGEQLARAGK